MYLSKKNKLKDKNSVLWLAGFVLLYSEFIIPKHKSMGLHDTTYVFQDGSVNIWGQGETATVKELFFLWELTEKMYFKKIKNLSVNIMCVLIPCHTST